METNEKRGIKEEMEMLKTIQLDGSFDYEGIRFYPWMKLDHVKELKKFQFRPSDIVISAFPKTGTTWVCEIILAIMHGNNEEATCKPQDDRLYFIDRDTIARLDEANQQKSQRVIKTHIRPEFYKEQYETKKPKIVVTIRNLKDTMTSLFHMLRATPIGRLLDKPTGFDLFFEGFKNGEIQCSGDYCDFYLDWLKYKSWDNVLFVSYEESIKNHRQTIINIARFLNKDLNEEEIDRIMKHTSFDEMKKNPATNLRSEQFLDQNVSEFIRKGKIGDHKTLLSQEQIEYVDSLLLEKFKGTTLEELVK